MVWEVTDNDLVDDRLTQGDVIRWDRADASHRGEYGIVVTADCDLVHNKMKGVISYVPLLRFEKYVMAVWGPDYVERRVKKILESAVSAMREAHKARRSSETLGEGGIRQWLIRDDAPAIASQLLGPEADDKGLRRLERIIAPARAALICESELLSDGDGTPYINRLTNAANVLFPDGKGNTKTISTAPDSHCNSLPGDVFFVSHLPGEGDDGYFALLRHISQFNMQNISLDPVQRPGPVLPARRIGKLKAPYIYALTQQMARVFADIDLPTDHSERLVVCTRNYLSGT
jgi:hypothetical protein